MEQQVREPQGGEAITDVILRRAEKRVQNSVFKELLCDGNHNVLQVSILGKKKRKHQTIENFTGFALPVQNKNCTETEQLANAYHLSQQT